MNSQCSTPLIKITQWLKSWEKAQWDDEKGLGRPADHFFVGAMPLTELRSLAGVAYRSLEQRKDPQAVAGYQRAHEESRSKKINRYLQYGYPLSTSTTLNPEQHEELINPGWLPNAIIINIIPIGSVRHREGKQLKVPSELEVKINWSSPNPTLMYPTPDTVEKFKSLNDSYIEPVEIIDGQHRLYAVDANSNMDGCYEVPVVIFYDLSLAWQAYLFWTINVEPKKINPSLAFDLYPELRRQDWLDKSETIKIYQEHRSQEMAEVLWSHDRSPWKDRIELFGSRVKGHVSNASFIRSLNRTFIKKWVKGERVGGLFGSIRQNNGTSDRVIPWQRSQQAAFLIAIWTEVHAATKRSKANWVRILGTDLEQELPGNMSPAFAGEHSLLATDQGVQAVHSIFNAIFQDSPELFELESWRAQPPAGASLAPEEIDEALEGFRKLEKANAALTEISTIIIDNFDWRISSAPGLDEEELQMQSAYRGGSGYTLMMTKLLKKIVDQCETAEIKEIARQVSSQLVRKGQ